MKGLLVDTSAYAAFFRGHPGVTAAVRAADELFLSSHRPGQHGLTVITLDGDFDRIPQVLVQKFEPRF